MKQIQATFFKCEWCGHVFFKETDHLEAACKVQREIVDLQEREYARDLARDIERSCRAAKDDKALVLLAKNGLQEAAMERAEALYYDFSHNFTPQNHDDHRIFEAMVKAAAE